MLAHDVQRLGMIAGRQEAHFTADQLGMSTWAALTAQQIHLGPHLRNRMAATDCDLVRITRVIARRAREIAAREHSMRSFTSHRVLAKRLSVGTDAVG